MNCNKCGAVMRLIQVDEQKSYNCVCGSTYFENVNIYNSSSYASISIKIFCDALKTAASFPIMEIKKLK